MSGVGLSREEMKDKILGYLQYMEEKELQEISVSLYNLAKRRREIKLKEEKELDGK